MRSVGSIIAVEDGTRARLTSREQEKVCAPYHKGGRDDYIYVVAPSSKRSPGIDRDRNGSGFPHVGNNLSHERARKNGAAFMSSEGLFVAELYDPPTAG